MLPASALIKSVELEKCLKNCQKKNGKKRSKSPKVEGVAGLKMSTTTSNQSRARRCGVILRKRDRRGMEFDTMDWYRKNVLHPVQNYIKKGQRKKNTTPIS